ncbi:MAG: hypothetical protein K5669_11035 [Lachnospiraceae bacterium]|nr:hypothetical protein [Lachnospiraceae bacterium]
MIFTVFNKEITFTEKEISVFQALKLDLSTELLELMLWQIGVNDLEGKTKKEGHDLCIKAIVDYANTVLNVSTIMKDDVYRIEQKVQKGIKS